MNILIIGSGGREHALAWKIAQSPKASRIFCAPGNAGTSEIAENINIGVEDIIALRDFAKKQKIDLTIVGPEVPLVLGIVEEFESHGLKIFGPTSKAAMIEGSKVFSKEIMDKYGIPTGKAKSFTDETAAKAFIKEIGAPLVIKADGLAAGKGVIICQTEKEAEHAVERILKEKEFGEAGSQVLVEEFLEGEEVSLLCFSDGKTILPMASAQDHKRVNDNDEGPNTGGMGAYSPAPIFTDDLLKLVEKEILLPTIAGMSKEGRPFKGILFVGLMLTKDGPKVLEYNARFGDPETQCVLPRLKTDLLEIMLHVVNGSLSKISLEWNAKPAVCVVLAAGGYPGNYKKGEEISGLDKARDLDDVIIFQAGTRTLVDDNGMRSILTKGGRVLNVIGIGNTIPQAIENSYAAVKAIHFKDMHYRKDIGKKALK